MLNHDLLTVREVARHLRVDDTTVRRWITSGALEAIELPHVHKRRAYRVSRAVLERTLTNPTILEESTDSPTAYNDLEEDYDGEE